MNSCFKGKVLMDELLKAYFFIANSKFRIYSCYGFYVHLLTEVCAFIPFEPKGWNSLKCCFILKEILNLDMKINKIIYDYIQFANCLLNQLSINIFV